MAGKSSKTKPVSVRVPNDLLAVLDGWAAKNGETRAAAVIHFIQAGIDAEDGVSAPATRDDLAAISAKIDAIEANQKLQAAALLEAVKNQPIAVQEQKALPDADAWKDKGLLARILKR